MSDFKVQTETIELPSKGLVYPTENPLSLGTIEMKYMTAKEEDILMNQNYIKKGVAIDKLMKALIVSKVNYDELIIGDKNAVLIASRILGYGPEYSFDYEDKENTVDLSLVENKPIDESLFPKGTNDFSYTFPHSQIDVTFKFLTGIDENNIERELSGLKKINKNHSPDLSTKMKFILTSIKGDRESKTIREFVDNHLLARDAKSLRNHIRDFQPDVDLTFFPNDGSEGANIPIGIRFFWPDFG